ncbi:MAG: Crp/Fnr family transcriptional regulator [Coriobacteriales bacterium]|jgi:CRP/FNR family transcriptional regulator|nr:Crp/Fnr family transcriptional regulator [Coriobacteriales bacterium]
MKKQMQTHKATAQLTTRLTAQLTRAESAACAAHIAHTAQATQAAHATQIGQTACAALTAQAVRATQATKATQTTNTAFSASVRQALTKCELLQGLNLSPKNTMLKELKRGQITSDSINGRAACGLVVTGTIDVYNVAADGHEIRLSRLHAGDCFGLANLFGNASLKTVLKCHKNATVLFFSKQLLCNALQNDLALANRLLQFYCQKVDFLLLRIEHLTMHFASGKLSEYLLAQSASQTTVTLEMTKDELASQLGISRATLYRELKRLTKLGGIKVEKRTIVILRPQVLQDLASWDK